MSIGYFLSCEEFGPRELVRQAKLAEQAGFERLRISQQIGPDQEAFFRGWSEHVLPELVGR